MVSPIGGERRMEDDKIIEVSQGAWTGTFRVLVVLEGGKG